MIAINENLSGKLAVITGGAGILCSTIARELARHKVKIAILDISMDKAEELAEEINRAGGTAAAFYCDVLDKESAVHAHDIVAKTFGECDILINGAGGNNERATTADEVFNPDEETVKSFYELTKEGFSFVFDLNFISCFIVTQAFSKGMMNRKGAVIINISSMSAPCPMTKVPAYSAAKAAIDNFTQWLAVYFSNTNIRVNAIAPGFFITEQNRKLLTNEDGSYTSRSKKIMAHTPMKRFGVPEDLAGTIIWLADESMSSFVTGIVVPVDGGFMSYSGV